MYNDNNKILCKIGYIEEGEIGLYIVYFKI